jgi:hypothetical protein
MKRGLGVAILVGIVGATALNAAFKTSVNTKPGFRDPLSVAVVVAQCQPSMDCADLGGRGAAAVAAVMKEWKVIPSARSRQALFEQGKEVYSVEDRESLVALLNADALLEVVVQSAATGDGYGGMRGSEVNLLIRLVRPDGELLLQGSGTGRPMNVVTSPERVGATVIEKILKDALDKK